MKRVFATIAVSSLLLMCEDFANAQTAPNDEAKRLRGEIGQVESQIAELTARLKYLEEQLSKAETTSRGQSPALRFPLGIERAMLGDGVSPGERPQRRFEPFDVIPKKPPMQRPRQP